MGDDDHQRRRPTGGPKGVASDIKSLMPHGHSDRNAQCMMRSDACTTMHAQTGAGAAAGAAATGGGATGGDGIRSPSPASPALAVAAAGGGVVVSADELDRSEKEWKQQQEGALWRLCVYVSYSCSWLLCCTGTAGAGATPATADTEAQRTLTVERVRTQRAVASVCVMTFLLSLPAWLIWHGDIRFEAGPGADPGVEAAAAAAAAPFFDVCTYRNFSDHEAKDLPLPLTCDDIRGFLLQKRIGKGFWRDVYLEHLDGKALVVKKMSRKHSHSTRNIVRHARETGILYRLRHNPHVVHVLGYCDTTVVTEYFPTTLDTIAFQKKHSLPFDRVLRYAIDVAMGMAAVHEMENGPAVHADIQARQFLLGKDDVVRINDLNRARVMMHNSKGPCPFRITTAKGRWRAPEEYNFGDLTEKLDIYSMGLVLWTLVSRQPPFDNFEHQEDVWAYVRAGGRPKISPSWNPVYARVVSDCWAQDPNDRPSARQVADRLRTLQQDLGFSNARARLS